VPVQKPSGDAPPPHTRHTVHYLRSFFGCTLVVANGNLSDVSLMSRGQSGVEDVAPIPPDSTPPASRRTRAKGHGWRGARWGIGGVLGLIMLGSLTLVLISRFGGHTRPASALGSAEGIARVVGGRLVFPGWRPYPHTSVQVLSTGGKWIASTRTGPDGRYLVPLTPGTYQVRLSCFTVWNTPITITVRAGQSTTGADLLCSIS
jgi:hypothetical protein